MGKNEGMNTTNAAKRQVQNVWVKDKLDTQYPGFCILSVFFYFFVRGCCFWKSPLCLDSGRALRPGWFIHENVLGYPKEYLSESFDSVYECQETQISPQRFGKPMNRHVTVSKISQRHLKHVMACQSWIVLDSWTLKASNVSAVL
jgi:hypothetical protein